MAVAEDEGFHPAVSFRLDGQECSETVNAGKLRRSAKARDIWEEWAECGQEQRLSSIPLGVSGADRASRLLTLLVRDTPSGPTYCFPRC